MTAFEVDSMTNEEMRARFREFAATGHVGALGGESQDFSSMTLAQLEALAERFGAAVRTIHEARALLGGGGVAPSASRGLQTLTMPSGAPAPTSDSPFPCAGCGRERPQSPREPVQARACDVCGNNLPARPGEGVVVTNKPAVVRNGAVTAMVAPLSAEERAAKLALPAFVNGEPVAE